MGFTNTGTRGEPFVASAGNPPTFAADMSGISSFFAARSFRSFATVAAMVASTGSGANEWAKCDNAPGALYYSDGTRWYLGNQPVVASSSARDALFTGTCQPVQGTGVFRSDLGTEENYYAVWNASTNPRGAGVAGWYDVDNGLFNAMYQYTAGTLSTAGATGVDLPYDASGTAVYDALGGAFTLVPSTGIFTCVVAGTYEITNDTEWQGSTAGVRTSYIQKALAATPTTYVSTRLATSGTPVTASITAESFGRFIETFAVGDKFKIGIIQTAGGTLLVIKSHTRVQRIA